MLKYGLPLSIASIISGFQTQFYGVLIANPIYTSASQVGNYNLAMNFAVLITFFSTPVTTMMFPAFSKVDAKKDPETLKNVFQYSVKYATLLVAPAAGIVMALSEPGISTLFGHQYASAPLFLALLAASYLYSAFGTLSTGNLINSQGQTQFNLKLTILTAAIGVPEGFILISHFGILGLIITTLTAGLPSTIISLQFVKRHYGATVNWTSSAKILLSSATAAAITYVLTSYAPFNNLIKLVIGAIIFLFTFVVAISLTRTIDKSDIANLRAMLGGLGPLRPLLKFLLNIIERNNDNSQTMTTEDTTSKPGNHRLLVQSNSRRKETEYYEEIVFFRLVNPKLVLAAPNGQGRGMQST